MQQCENIAVDGWYSASDIQAKEQHIEYLMFSQKCDVTKTFFLGANLFI